MRSATPLKSTATGSRKFTRIACGVRPDRGSRKNAVVTKILTLGDNSAIVNLEFKMPCQDRIGRQSQTGVGFPDLGCKVVAAHVSKMD